MEPSRASSVQPNKHQLGGKASQDAEYYAWVYSATTAKGLRVKAYLDENLYQGGQKITKGDMEQLGLVAHTICPKWNYTLSPRTSRDDQAH